MNNGVKIYEDMIEWLALYSDDAELYRDIMQAFFHYALTGEKPQDKNLWRIIMPYCQNTDRMKEKDYQISKKRAEAGKKGGAPKGNTNATKSNSYNEFEEAEKQAKTSKNKQKQAKQTINTKTNTNSNTNTNSKSKSNDVEEKEKEKESTAFSSTAAAADQQFSQREEELYNMLKDEHQWIEAIQRELKVQDVQPIITDFRKACVLNGKTEHDNLQDLKQHIYNFSKIRKGAERKAKGGNPLQDTLDAIFKTYDTHARN